ncbi:MAG: tyrosine-type recombinase/integrase [Chloroflexi bacterium]|nr:tyrosine-type recombinase/integrase [Chloroflexota bacterium]
MTALSKASPIDGVDRVYLEPEDIAAMEEVAPSQRDRLMLRLLFRLGCRVSELLGLGPHDFDLARGTITILHLKQRLSLRCPECNAQLGRAHRFCPGCGQPVAEVVRKEVERRRVRTLHLDGDTLAMVRGYLEAVGPQDRVFPIARNTAWRIVKNCAAKVGLHGLVNPETGRTRGVSPHRLRDAFAVHALKTDDSGEGMRFLQEWLGHSRYDTTARYRKVSGTELRQWHDRLWQNSDST